MALINQIRDAVNAGHLARKFSTANVRNWITAHNIRKEDGGEYASSSIDSILSNSCIRNEGSSNRNVKVLRSAMRDGVTIYWFAEDDLRSVEVKN